MAEKACLHAGEVVQDVCWGRTTVEVGVDGGASTRCLFQWCVVGCDSGAHVPSIGAAGC